VRPDDDRARRVLPGNPENEELGISRREDVLVPRHARAGDLIEILELPHSRGREVLELHVEGRNCRWVRKRRERAHVARERAVSLSPRIRIPGHEDERGRSGPQERDGRFRRHGARDDAPVEKAVVGHEDRAAKGARRQARDVRKPPDHENVPVDHDRVRRVVVRRAVRVEPQRQGEIVAMSLERVRCDGHLDAVHGDRDLRPPHLARERHPEPRPLDGRAERREPMELRDAAREPVERLPLAARSGGAVEAGGAEARQPSEVREHPPFRDECREAIRRH
jgi:hypothetical protein